MSLDIQSPTPGRPLKRSLDDSCVPQSPIKRVRLPPTPATAGDSVDKPLPPNTQSNAPTPPSTTQSNTQPPYGLDAECESAHARRICDWLATVPPPRPSSVPPHRPGSAPPNFASTESLIDWADYQKPTFAAMQQLSALHGESTGKGSASTNRSSRLGTENPRYLRILHVNRVRIDLTGEKISKELRTFIDTHILKQRLSQLSPIEVAEVVQCVPGIANDVENDVYELVNTPMFPIRRLGMKRGGNTPWYNDGLPRGTVGTTPLSIPKPDIHCGYPPTETYEQTFWSDEEGEVIGHDKISRLAAPTISNSFPFFVLEVKSEATHGTLLHAERQAAGSGGYCVNAMRTLLGEASKASRTPPPTITDSIAFSASITHRQAVIYVHWYDPEKDLHYMSWIAGFSSLRNPQGCNHVVDNILDHCLGARQTKIRQALKQLYPLPSYWKSARSSEMADEDGSAKKSQRTK
ncbi:MAG: hypothetical protein LQ350_004068 [Teloschistes chrysophthalmus]|nr:MAG: hypothetical protein LQ350_004068 [Niorma chrysophthalma]